MGACFIDGLLLDLYHSRNADKHSHPGYFHFAHEQPYQYSNIQRKPDAVLYSFSDTNHYRDLYPYDTGDDYPDANNYFYSR